MKDRPRGKGLWALTDRDLAAGRWVSKTSDSCDLARGDLNLDGCVDSGDLGLLIALWGFTDPPFGDLNGDGIISAADLGLLIGNWAPCP